MELLKVGQHKERPLDGNKEDKIDAAGPQVLRQWLTGVPYPRPPLLSQDSPAPVGSQCSGKPDPISPQLHLTPGLPSVTEVAGACAGISRTRAQAKQAGERSPYLGLHGPCCGHSVLGGGPGPGDAGRALLAAPSPLLLRPHSQLLRLLCSRGYINPAVPSRGGKSQRATSQPKAGTGMGPREGEVEWRGGRGADRGTFCP